MGFLTIIKLAAVRSVTICAPCFLRTKDGSFRIYPSAGQKRKTMQVSSIVFLHLNTLPASIQIGRKIYFVCHS